MKPDTRNKVLRNYGEKVVCMLDRIATAMCREATAYYAGDEITRSACAADVSLLHADLSAANGPVGNFLITPKADKMPILRILIQDFHDLDDAVEKHFDGTDGVLTDSEASCPFIYCTEAATPKVIKMLEEFYPGVTFEASPVDTNCTVNTVLVNWTEAKAWQALQK